VLGVSDQESNITHKLSAVDHAKHAMEYSKQMIFAMIFVSVLWNRTEEKLPAMNAFIDKKYCLTNHFEIKSKGNRSLRI